VAASFLLFTVTADCQYSPVLFSMIVNKHVMHIIRCFFCNFLHFITPNSGPYAVLRIGEYFLNLFAVVYYCDIVSLLAYCVQV